MEVLPGLFVDVKVANSLGSSTHRTANTRPLVIANWKMNGTLHSIRPLVKAIRAGLSACPPLAEVVICPPHVYLAELAADGPGAEFELGAQDISSFAEGPHTGEISSAMLKDYNCRFVLTGHSERRQAQQEPDELVARKFCAALAADLTPVLCVGEGLAERDAGRTEEVVMRQLDAVIAECGKATVGNGVIAYEPVWAIGTGRSAAPEQAAAAHALIRNRLASVDAAAARTTRIVYGGSVNPGNVRELLEMDEIDGVLVGGASLKAQEFLAICNAAQEEIC